MRTLQSCELSTSLLSLVTGSIGIFLWCRMAPERRTIFRLQLLVSLMLFDCLKAFILVVISARRFATMDHLLNDSSFDHRFCQGMGFILSLVTFLADYTMFLITIHNGLVVFAPALTRPYHRRIPSFRIWFNSLWQVVTLRRNPLKGLEVFEKDGRYSTQNEGGLFRVRWISITLSLIIGLVLSGVVFIGPGVHYDNNHFCSVTPTPTWKKIVNDWAFKYLNIAVIITVYGSIILSLRFKLMSIEKSKRSVYDDAPAPTINGSQSTGDITRNLQRELMAMANDANVHRDQAAWREVNLFVVYPLGYIVVWASAAVMQVWNYINGNGLLPFGLSLAMATTVPLSCTVDTIIFMVKEKPWTVTAKMLASGPSLGSGGDWERAIEDEEKLTGSNPKSVDDASLSHDQRNSSQTSLNTKTHDGSNSRRGSMRSHFNLNMASAGQFFHSLPTLNDAEERTPTPFDDDQMMDLGEILGKGPGR